MLIADICRRLIAWIMAALMVVSSTPVNPHTGSDPEKGSMTETGSPRFPKLLS